MGTFKSVLPEPSGWIRAPEKLDFAAILWNDALATFQTPSHYFSPIFERD
jgi:hypothetical protein